MKSLPVFAGPPPARLGFVGVFQPKKSCKTSTATLMANQIRDMGLEPNIFQHDRHDRLTPYGDVSRIELAKTSDVIGGDTSANLKRHEALAEAIEMLPTHPNQVILLDSSGPAASLMAPLLHLGRFDSLLTQHGISGLLLVPMRPILDVAEGALAMARELREAMPGQLVVPVAIASQSELEALDPGHPFWTVVKEARDGVFTLPPLAPSTASGLERVLRPVSEIADRTSETALTMIRNYTGYGRIEAGAVAIAAASLVTALDQGLAPMGFTPGA